MKTVVPETVPWVRIPPLPPKHMRNKREHALFAYGTLSFPEILGALLGRPIEGKPAQIIGYKNVRIRNRVYPGLIIGDSPVEGLLYSDISVDEFRLLNSFEGKFYVPEMAKARLADGQIFDATTYVIAKANLSKATNEVWNKKLFAQTYLERYLKIIPKYREGYLSGMQQGFQDGLLVTTY